MNSELIAIHFNKILQSQNYTLFILGSRDKQFAIYTSPCIGQNLKTYFANETSVRPHTHDLIHAIFNGLKIRILQIVINDVQDTLYCARLFIEQERNGTRYILEIDARPSDCLILAIQNESPIYCTKEVFDKATPVDETF